MKHLLAIALLVVAVNVWGQTNEYFVANISGGYCVRGTNISLAYSEEFIRRLAASGEICKVFGHWWERDWLSSVQLVYYSEGQPLRRKCKLCGRVETKTEEWK